MLCVDKIVLVVETKGEVNTKSLQNPRLVH